jgi:8-oxo-dGTP diphosphatase
MNNETPEPARYVAGFMFDHERSEVALIRKAKTAWQKGLLNGIGGKIEVGETPEQAMVREFGEETGCANTEQSFRHYALIHGAGWSVDFFYTIGDLSQLRTMEEEPIERVKLLDIHVLRSDMVENLPWLISLAIDQRDDARPSFATVRYP